jgi:integrase
MMAATVSASPQPLRAVGDGSLEGLWALLDAWSDHLVSRGIADATRDQYEQYLLRALRRMRAAPETVTTRQLEGFIAGVPQKGSSRSAYVSAFRSFFRFVHREQLRSDNPAVDLRTKPPKYPDPDYFEPEEARRIIEAATMKHPRRGWAITLLFETGARIGSVAAAAPTDIRDGRIQLRVTKGDRPYSLPLTPAAQVAVRELEAMMAPDQATLVGVKKERLGQWFHAAALTAGFPPGRVHAHLARHTAATLFYRRTRDVMATQRYLNHADLSQVMRYVRVADDQLAEPLMTSILEPD